MIRKGKKILITRRPEKGLLGGLWEFPGGKQKPGESLAECLKREIEEELGIEISVGEPFMQVNHAYSHFKITLHPFFCRHLKGRHSKDRGDGLPLGDFVGAERICLSPSRPAGDRLPDGR